MGLPFVAVILAIIGLSLLFPAVVNVESRRKRSLAEESNPVYDLAERVQDMYSAVLRSESCMEISSASSVAWPRTSPPPPSLDWSSPSCPPSTPTCTRPSRTARTATRSSVKQLIFQTRNLLITFANRGLDQNGTRKNITTAMEKWGQLHPSPTTLLLLLLPIHRKLDLLT